MTELIKKLEAEAKQIPTTFRVKLTGDGTQMHIEEGSSSRSASGNHGLSIVKVSDTYDDLARGLGDIRSEARDLEVLAIDGVVYRNVFSWRGLKILGNG